MSMGMCTGTGEILIFDGKVGFLGTNTCRQENVSTDDEEDRTRENDKESAHPCRGLRALSQNTSNTRKSEKRERRGIPDGTPNPPITIPISLSLSPFSRKTGDDVMRFVCTFNSTLIVSWEREEMKRNETKKRDHSSPMAVEDRYQCTGKESIREKGWREESREEMNISPIRFPLPCKKNRMEKQKQKPKTTTTSTTTTRKKGKQSDKRIDVFSTCHNSFLFKVKSKNMLLRRFRRRALGPKI